jgi:hypothetical protein
MNPFRPEECAHDYCKSEITRECMRCGRMICEKHRTPYQHDRRFVFCSMGCPSAPTEAVALGLVRDERPKYRSGKVAKQGPDLLDRILSNREWRGAEVTKRGNDVVLRKGSAVACLFPGAFEEPTE